MRQILATLLSAALLGATGASHAKLPPPPPKSDAEKAAEAQKAAAARAKTANELGKAEDRAVANYKKNRGPPAGPKKN
jgi:hypothetical protein